MKTKILMVCLGNICRSPLAEGILTDKLNQDSFFIDSAGTGGYHIGNSPDKRSIAVAKKNNIDISKQRCRKFEIADFTTFDFIYVMDYSNYKNILSLTTNKEEQNKVKLLLEAAGQPISEVPDPYYDDNGFEYVFELIDSACTILTNKLTKFKED
tara:strand:- start:16602 stop:17066 length:465 start_codon:yes stop_codon:yes gene_type:complete